MFRDNYIAGVRRLVKAGELRVQDANELESLLNRLTKIDWNVFIEPPPKTTSDREHVVKYLARYMTGGPVSDRRLIEVKNDRVYFWARKNDKSGRSERASLDGHGILSRRPSWRELFYDSDHPSWIENRRTPVSIESD